jgi:NTE family protein
MIVELCLSGACNRGICYIGAIQKLKPHLDLKKIIGTSIGSLIAACYIIGYDFDDLFRLVLQKDLKDLKDYSFYENYSFLKGEEYCRWVRFLLSEKINPDITLKQLYEQTNVCFVIVATCIHGPVEGPTYFCHDTHPDVSLFDALISSMSVPMVFPPVKIGDSLYIDGGLLDNFPVKMLAESNGVGITVGTDRLNGEECLKNPFMYLSKIGELLCENLKYYDCLAQNNIICVPCNDFNIIDFDITIDDKITLYKRGYDCASAWLSEQCPKIPQ